MAPRSPPRRGGTPPLRSMMRARGRARLSFRAFPLVRRDSPRSAWGQGLVRSGAGPLPPSDPRVGLAGGFHHPDLIASSLQKQREGVAYHGVGAQKGYGGFLFLTHGPYTSRSCDVNVQLRLFSGGANKKMERAGAHL